MFAPFNLSFALNSSANISVKFFSSGQKMLEKRDNVDSLLATKHSGDSLFVDTSSAWEEVSVWSAMSDSFPSDPTPESSSETDPREPALFKIFPLSYDSGIDVLSLSGWFDMTTISGRLSDRSASPD